MRASFRPLANGGQMSSNRKSARLLHKRLSIASSTGSKLASWSLSQRPSSNRLANFGCDNARLGTGSEVAGLVKKIARSFPRGAGGYPRLKVLHALVIQLSSEFHVISPSSFLTELIKSYDLQKARTPSSTQTFRASSSSHSAGSSAKFSSSLQNSATALSTIFLAVFHGRVCHDRLKNDPQCCGKEKSLNQGVL